MEVYLIFLFEAILYLEIVECFGDGLRFGVFEGSRIHLSKLISIMPLTNYIKNSS